MSHTYSQNHLHLVFSTKDRQKLITPPMQPKLWAYMAGMEDHVHLLIQLPPMLALAKAVSLLKTNSSSWMSDHGMKFAWQQGYGAFSVSASKLSTVERYIANQAQHHRRKTFEDEFVGLLKKHGIPFDPKYVFG